MTSRTFPADLVSVGQFACLAGVSKRTIYTWIKEGKVRAEQIAGRHLISVSANHPIPEMDSPGRPPLRQQPEPPQQSELPPVPDGAGEPDAVPAAPEPPDAVPAQPTTEQEPNSSQA